MGALRLAEQGDPAAPGRDPVGVRVRANTEQDQDRLAAWLATELCPVELSRDRLAAAVVARCRNDHLEPPAPGQVRRLVGKAIKDFEKRFCRSTLDRLSHTTRSRLHKLLAA
ncbi:hypothetical protein OG459_01045 [Streptomyces canus]